MDNKDDGQLTVREWAGRGPHHCRNTANARAVSVPTKITPEAIVPDI